MLKGKCILLGVTGGIAAYKAAALCSMLVKAGCDVRVVMTKNATQFITPLTFETLSKQQVITDTFDRSHPWEVEHIALADRADLVLIAPATADVLAKLAHGIADDMLTTTVLACDCPKIAAPAMNTKMYDNPVTQDNLQVLRHYGWEILEPSSGRLACGSVGKGKLPEPEELYEAVVRAISHVHDMEGLKVLVTAGPTQEALDPVRFLTNHSTGKMGYAIARAAAFRGAEVTLVSGPTSLRVPSCVHFVPVVSAEDMYEAVTFRQPEQDVIIKAAAVADYRPAHVSDQKIKKSRDGSDLLLPLARTKDILAALGAHRVPGQTLCGFSMETQHLLENSREKLVKKHLDLVAANSICEQGAGFGVDTNILTLIDARETVQLPLLSKEEAADRLLDRILELRKGSGEKA